MPPKSIKNLPVIIKCKRQAQTVFLTLLSKDNIVKLKTQLVDILNQTGGLVLNNQPIMLDEEQELQDIAIPKPISSGISDSDSENELETGDSANDTKETIAPENSPDKGVIVSIDDITIGTFLDPNDIYGSSIDILDIDDLDKIEKIGWKDFQVLAFKYRDENFKIFKPELE